MIDGDKPPDPGAEPGASTRWNYCCFCETLYTNPEEAIDCCQAIEATNITLHARYFIRGRGKPKPYPMEDD